MDELISEIRACGKAPGVGRIYLPGEIEAETQAKARTNGILLDAETYDSFRRLDKTWRSTLRSFLAGHKITIPANRGMLARAGKD